MMCCKSHGPLAGLVLGLGSGDLLFALAGGPDSHEKHGAGPLVLNPCGKPHSPDPTEQRHDLGLR